MAAGDRGSRGRQEYGRTERDRGDDRRQKERESQRERQEAQQAAEREAQQAAQREAQQTAQREAAASNQEDPRAATTRRAMSAFGTPAYGRFSTPSPIGGPSSYGLSQDDYDTISEPHQAASPDRFESWAKDVLTRGGPTTPREEERLGEGLQAHDTYQAAKAFGSVAGLANPIAGAAIRGVESLHSQFQSPTYQGARDLSAASSPVSEAVGSVAGALGSLAPGSSLASAVSNIGQVAGPIGEAAETATSPTGSLFGQIRTSLGLDRATKAFGGPRGDNRDSQVATTPSLAQPAPAPTSSSTGFQAADPFEYGTFLNRFTAG